MMSPSSTHHRSATPPFFCSARRGLWAPVRFSGPPSWKLVDSCSLVAWSAFNCYSSDGSSTPIHGRLPAACCAATRRLVSAATIPKARLRSKGPATSPCSAPSHPSSPSCSMCDRFRCFHAAAAVCLGRNRDAASRTACHSIIPQQFSRQL